MRKTYAVLLFLIAGAAQAADLSDNELSRRVKGALSATIGAPARDIEIIVLDRTVSLHGRVPSQSVREAAATAAERTLGVRGVTNNLSVGGGR